MHEDNEWTVVLISQAVTSDEESDMRRVCSNRMKLRIIPYG
jgi:hypothetical protein